MPPALQLRNRAKQALTTQQGRMRQKSLLCTCVCEESVCHSGNVCLIAQLRKTALFALCVQHHCKIKLRNCAKWWRVCAAGHWSRSLDHMLAQLQLRINLQSTKAKTPRTHRSSFSPQHTSTTIAHLRNFPPPGHRLCCAELNLSK